MNVAVFITQLDLSMIFELDGPVQIIALLLLFL